MSKRYLNKFSNVDTDYDKQIKGHLERAKKELVSALGIIADKRRNSMLFRMASKTTEYEIRGILSLLDSVKVIKPVEQSESLSPKQLREQRRDRKLGKQEVTNVRRK